MEKSKAFDIIYDTEKKQFLKIVISYDLETKEAKIEEVIPYGDSTAVAVYNAKKDMIIKVMDIKI